MALEKGGKEEPSQLGRALAWTWPHIAAAGAAKAEATGRA